jgi:hypothetical protein
MKKVIVFLGLAFITGCSSVQFNDFLGVWRTMNFDKFCTELSVNKNDGFNISANGILYWVYPISMTTEKEESSGTHDGQPVETTSYYSNFYYFVFKEDRLFFYGFLYEMRRHTEKEILEIGESIYNYKFNN